MTVLGGVQHRGPAPARAIEAEAVLRALAERHRSARFAAVDGSASPTPVPVPVTVPVPRAQVVEDRELLDRIAPEDRATVAKLWGRARALGFARGPIRLEDRPGFLHVFDLRARHGVLLLAFVEGVSEPDLVPDPGALTRLRPRYARATKDAAARYQSIDAAFTEMLGWAAEELMGQRSVAFVHPDDREIGVANWLEMLDATGEGRRMRVRHRHRDGHWVWLEVTNHNRLGGPEGDILTEIVDISEEMAAHEALRAREQLLAQVTDTVPVGLFHTDAAGTVLFSNRPLHDLTGTPAAATLDGQLAAVVPGDRPALQDAVRRAAGGEQADAELAVRTPDGGLRHCRLRVLPLRDDDGAVTGLTGCLEDVTEMVRSRRELEVMAASDLLTGCLNREATLMALQEHLDGAPGSGTAAIFIDLDGFKQVNDVFGHAAGDGFLVTVAERIRATIRAGDLLGRFGGDEFVVVCPDVRGPAEALEIARALATRAIVREDPALPPVQASVGVAWTDEAHARADRLVQAADAAMYTSKRSGRGEPALAEVHAAG